MEKCPFCNIISGSIPGVIVREDETSLAIMDNHPINPGHVLVILKDHTTNFGELSPEVGSHLFLVGQKLAKALYASGIPCQEILMLLSDGDIAEKETSHVHLHVIPRFDEDGFGFQFSPRYAELPTWEELEKNAYHLKQALGQSPD